MILIQNAVCNTPCATSYNIIATMSSYQSNPTRIVQESYDSSTLNGRLLHDNGINVGASNSARGMGTTTAELVAKTRFLNCCACLFILLFHTLPILLNPIRLTLLLSTPMRLLLQLIIAVLALGLLLVEARIPILGEKVLVLIRKVPCFDMNIPKGRVFALMIMGVCLVWINYMNLGSNAFSHSKSGGDERSIPSASANMTNATDSLSNVTESGNENDSDIATYSKSDSTIMLFVILQCLASPSVLILVALSVYTIYLMHTFPEFSMNRAYEIVESDTTTTIPAATGPSWTSNVGSSVRGSGYQTVDT